MITIRVAESVDEAALVLKNDELFDRISEEGQQIEDFIIPFDDQNVYMMVYWDDCAIGLYHLHPHNHTTLNVHCNFLKKHRDHAKEAGKLLYEWLIDECDFEKFITEVPFIYPEVYHYAKNFGFKDEGINRQSIKKQGQYVDQWRIGITKNEVKLWLQQQQ